MLNKTRYCPDLNRLMADSESNYVRLLKLMPDFDSRDQWLWGVQLPKGIIGQICFEVTERFKYTSTVCIRQQDRLGAWLSKPSLVIRMYHDAGMAEVVNSKNKSQLKGTYPYPNKDMFQSDEKEQLNAYLGEWLSQCLHHGYSGQSLRLEGLTI